MTPQAVTKATEKHEIGWKKVESADVLSPFDWEVEVTEVFQRPEDPGHVSEGLPFSSWSSGEQLPLTFNPKKEKTKPPQNCKFSPLFAASCIKKKKKQLGF